LKDKLLRVYRRLLKAYGPPDRPGLDPVSEMVSTILSQNTNDSNRDRAYDRLRARFPAWEEVRDASLAEVEGAIRPAGLSAQKAPRIQHALRTVTARAGRLSLDFLRDLPVEEARAWLTSINGIGPKTAAIILLFSLDMPAFPVDTSRHRPPRDHRSARKCRAGSRDSRGSRAARDLPAAAHAAHHARPPDLPRAEAGVHGVSGDGPV
jgi:endonuclease-3